MEYFTDKGGEKMARGTESSSKGDFMDYIKKASTDPLLRNALLAEAYKPGETPELLLKFFGEKEYYGVSYEDCQKLINVVHAGPLPCTFPPGQY